MSERRYTIAEIDRMRAAVDCLCRIGSSKAVDREGIIEHRLRTYLTAGTTPEELEIAVHEENTRIDAAIRARIKGQSK